jgi:hypothetical protein
VFKDPFLSIIKPGVERGIVGECCGDIGEVLEPFRENGVYLANAVRAYTNHFVPRRRIECRTDVRATEVSIIG